MEASKGAMTKTEKLLQYQLQNEGIAFEILRQSNPLTAWAYGLDNIAEAIGIDPRGMDELEETDVSLRERIMWALR